MSKMPNNQERTKEEVKEALKIIKQPKDINEQYENIYEFVTNKDWHLLGFNSFNECREKYNFLKSESYMRRICSAVDFHDEHLPDLKIFINEGTLRPICKNKYKESLKKRVAKKIMASKDPYLLKEIDINGFIEESKVFLNTEQKKVSSKLVKRAFPDNFLNEIHDYLAAQGFKSKRKTLFAQEMAMRVEKLILNNC